ncbi:Multidrug transporter MdfA [Rhodobacteraceae bacterium THAF1]|uniref:MFS transporter n=1 Tax=Palleronia sp. THAF1 TaxID=2587842 RepID=UPI000F41CFDD|nr:MFS transporter [Palleronia sp. THAF1]QFU09234.1 Multidrug transporter MdfA [Palleronia sp. THAF1]VDC27360.1 Multidrug transporter MdfA [Rhodobacteraceae bacterium THAF1]
MSRTDAKGWRPFIAASLAFFTVMAGATVPTPLYPLYAETYGFSPIIITAIFAIYSVGVIGALIVTGPWSEEIGRKPVLLAGVATALLASVVFAIADGLWLILLARLLQGVSVGLFNAAATIAVSEFAPKSHPRLGAIIATVANMGGLGMGAIIGGVVLTVLPWPLISPYLVHIAMAVLAGAFLWPAPDPVERSDSPDLSPQSLAVPSEVRDLFFPAAISAFSGFMVCGFLGAVAPSFLGKVLGYEGWHILIGFTAGLIFLTSCAAQAAEDFMPRKLVLPLGMGLLTLGLAAITAALAASTLIGLLAAIAFAGLGHGIAFKGGLSSLTNAAPEDQGASISATYFTVAYVAISIPVVIIGALQTVFDLQPIAVGYGIAATLLSALAFVLILRR